MTYQTSRDIEELRAIWRKIPHIHRHRLDEGIVLSLTVAALVRKAPFSAEEKAAFLRDQPADAPTYTFVRNVCGVLICNGIVLS